MNRPTVEVADILRAQGNRFLDRYEKSFDFQQLKAFRAIQRCRTAALGGHVDACPRCGYQAAISYNSCRNRHCPKCQTQAREHWLAARERDLLDTSYFHVVFTVPHELNVLALDNPRLFYDLLFTASAQTLLEVAADPKHLGATIGMTSILHTWGQNLLLHPHVHCAIPAGGLSADRGRWVPPRYPYLSAGQGSQPRLPWQVLRRLEAPLATQKTPLRGAVIHRGRSEAVSPTSTEAAPARLGGLRQTRFRRPHEGPALPGPIHASGPISNHRLLAFDGERVTFRWKDYAHGGKQRKMMLLGTEFLRRFFLHVLPKGFVRIRHFGFPSNRFRTSRLPLCRQLLATSTPEQPASPKPGQSSSTWHCPRCGAAMIVAQRLTAAEVSRCGYFDSS